MRVAFDLDGTLDRPAIRDLALVLLKAGHEVHIITGVFLEAGEWQSTAEKRKKITRLGIPYEEQFPSDIAAPSVIVRSEEGYEHYAVLHVLNAVDGEKYDREYRLVDLGLRKGALCEKLGITLFIDDSETYCKFVPAMSGGTTVLHVR